MAEALAFLEAILEDPDDDTPRLIFADWLEEQSDPDLAARGELVRLQCELASWVPDLDRRTRLQERERLLIEQHQDAWLGGLRTYCRAYRFERGLVQAALQARRLIGVRFAAAAAGLLRSAWVETIRLEGAARHLPALAAAPHLAAVRALDLGGSELDDKGLSVLLSSPHLAGLRRLDLDNNRVTDAGFRALLASPHLGRITRLDLRNNQLTAASVEALWGTTPPECLTWVDLHGNGLTAVALHSLDAWRRQRGGGASRLPRLQNSAGMELTRVPAGTFRMGSPSDEPGRVENEGPQHRVTLTHPFYLGVYQVTQQQYLAVMGHNPSFFTPQRGGGPDHPVEQVAWDDAVAFCARLSALPEEKAAGRVYRLPTEAEWEYACRAGTTTAFNFGASATSTQLNFDGNKPYGRAPRGPYLARTSRVGSYPPNAFGLYDTHGNVWEWCQDWFGKYNRRHQTDPTGAPRGSRHPLRGGSWYVVSRACRSAERCATDDAPVRRPGSVGFRVAFRPAPE
jgi:uncharacterized protein (TIGR02996 family)